MALAGNIWVRMGVKDNVTKQSKKIFSDMTKSAMKFASAFAGIKLLKDGIDQASDYAEAQDSLNRLIGTEGVAALEKFAETSATTAGMSRADALTTANNFAGLFQQIPEGAISTGKALADMEQRVADLGSQFNKSNEDINSGLQSALSGRVSLTLQQMGIDLSATAMQTRLASGAFTDMGFAADTSFASLDSGQQVLLRYQAFMDTTNASAGNFGQTLGISLPNQIKKMKAETADAASSIGKVLIPILTKVINIIGTLAKWIGKAKVLIGVFAGAIAAVKIGGFIKKIATMVSGFIALASTKAAAEGGIMGLITGGAVLAGLTAMVGGIAGGIFFSGGGTSSASTSASQPNTNAESVINITMNQSGEIENASSNGGTAVRAVGNMGKGTI